MKRIWTGVIPAALLFLGTSAANGQIRYLTVRAPRLPFPITAPMVLGVGATNLAQPFGNPVAQPQPAVMPAPQRVVVVQPMSDFDKAELEQRVVAFQKQRAHDGSASAQCELGLRYLNGNGVEKDEALGRKWLARAADGGETRAKTKLQELAQTPSQSATTPEKPKQ